MPNVTIYSTPSCVFCNMAKDFLKKNSVAYQDYDVSIDLAKRKEMIDLTGQMGVPVIKIGDKTVIGFDEGYIKNELGLK